jgi:hypothetical protein
MTDICLRGFIAPRWKKSQRGSGVLLIGPGFPRDQRAESELLAGLPFINLELVDLAGFRQFTERTFATDVNLIPKGMLEVSR